MVYYSAKVLNLGYRIVAHSVNDLQPSPCLVSMLSKQQDLTPCRHDGCVQYDNMSFLGLGISTNTPC